MMLIRQYREVGEHHFDNGETTKESKNDERAVNGQNSVVLIFYIRIA